MAPERSPSTSSAAPRALLVGLLAAGVGAVLVLLDLLGVVATVAGLGAIVLGTILTAPYAERPGAALRSWWTMLALGALVALLGAALELAVQALGGLLAVLGGAAVLAAAFLGYPLRRG